MSLGYLRARSYLSDLVAEYGFDRLHDAIKGARDLTAAQLIATLHESVGRFAGGTAQQDDLTAVVVKRGR